MGRVPPKGGAENRAAPKFGRPGGLVRASVERTSPFTLRAIATRVDDEVRRLKGPLSAGRVREIDVMLHGLSDAVAVSLGDRGVRAMAVDQVARALADSLGAFLLPVLAQQALDTAPTADGAPSPLPQGTFLDTVRLAREVVRLIEVLDPDAARGGDPPRRKLRTVVETLSARAIAVAVAIEGALGAGGDHPDLRLIARALLRVDILEWGIAEAGSKQSLATVRQALGHTVAAALGRATEVVDHYVATGGLEALTGVASVFALLDDLSTVIDSALERCAGDDGVESLEGPVLAEATAAFANAVVRLVRSCAAAIRVALAEGASPQWLPGLVRLLGRIDQLGRRFPVQPPASEPGTLAGPAVLALLPRDVAAELEVIGDILVSDGGRRRTPEVQALAVAVLGLLRRAGRRGGSPEAARA